MKFSNWLEHKYLTDFNANATDREKAVLDLLSQDSFKDKKLVVSRYRNPPIVMPILDEIEGKPNGGLWYGEGLSWMRHIRYNQDHIHMFVHEIFVDNSNICKIHTKNQRREFEERYGVPNKTWKVLIDWGSVKNNYGGIECLGEGFERQNWQYVWDVPSGCVWSRKCLVDSKLILIYDVENKKYTKPGELGIYAGLASKAKKVILPDFNLSRSLVKTYELKLSQPNGIKNAFKLAVANRHFNVIQWLMNKGIDSDSLNWAWKWALDKEDAQLRQILSR